MLVFVVFGLVLCCGVIVVSPCCRRLRSVKLHLSDCFCHLLAAKYAIIYVECGKKTVSRCTDSRPIIGIGRLSSVLPIIGIGRLVRWYRPIVVCTIARMLNEIRIFEASGFQLGTDSNFTNLKLDSRKLSQGDSQGVSPDLGGTWRVIV